MNEDNILPKDMNDTDVSRPQQGLPIINMKTITIVTMMGLCFRPQQGLPIMNKRSVHIPRKEFKFPSPTEVNHYELLDYKELLDERILTGFRPLQGLTIMNRQDVTLYMDNRAMCFRPLQGLTIMN